MSRYDNDNWHASITRQVDLDHLTRVFGDAACMIKETGGMSYGRRQSDFYRPAIRFPSAAHAAYFAQKAGEAIVEHWNNLYTNQAITGAAFLGTIGNHVVNDWGTEEQQEHVIYAIRSTPDKFLRIFEEIVAMLEGEVPKAERTPVQFSLSAAATAASSCDRWDLETNDRTPEAAQSAVQALNRDLSEAFVQAGGAYSWRDPDSSGPYIAVRGRVRVSGRVTPDSIPIAKRLYQEHPPV